MSAINVPLRYVDIFHTLYPKRRLTVDRLYLLPPSHIRSVQHWTDVPGKAEDMHTVNVGGAGCGQIGGIYLQNPTRVFAILESAGSGATAPFTALGSPGAGSGEAEKRRKGEKCRSPTIYAI